MADTLVYATRTVFVPIQLAGNTIGHTNFYVGAVLRDGQDDYAYTMPWFVPSDLVSIIYVYPIIATKAGVVTGKIYYQISTKYAYFGGQDQTNTEQTGSFTQSDILSCEKIYNLANWASLVTDIRVEDFVSFRFRRNATMVEDTFGEDVSFGIPYSV